MSAFGSNPLATTGPNRKPTPPAVVLIGGCYLAFLAAALNVTFILKLSATVSHLTGDVAHFGIDLASPGGTHSVQFGYLVAALCGFVLGAAVSGFLIHHPSLSLSRPYGRSIMGIGLVLLLTAWLMPDHPTVAVALAGGTCGFQNALASNFRGIILRTTHVTGLLTDLGIAIGMKVRGHNVAIWNLLVPLLLVLAFFTGGTSGAWLFLRMQSRAIFVIGGAYLLGGTVWTIVKHFVLRLNSGVSTIQPAVAEALPNNPPPPTA